MNTQFLVSHMKSCEFERLSMLCYELSFEFRCLDALPYSGKTDDTAERKGRRADCRTAAAPAACRTRARGHSKRLLFEGEKQKINSSLVLQRWLGNSAQPC